MAILSKFLAGGQTWAHRIRMLRHVFKIATAISMCCALLVLLYLLCSQPFILYQSLWYYMKVHFLELTSDTVVVNSDYWDAISNERHFNTHIELPLKTVLTYTEPYVELFSKLFSENLETTSSVSFFTFLGLLLFFLARGYVTGRKKHISGRRITAAWVVSLKLKIFRNASKVKLGKLPLVKGTETQHIMVTGGTGSGKTNCFHHILPQIRQNNQKAIIVDTTGTFVKRYFVPGRDVLLNPFDPNSSHWHPWAECKDACDFEDLAECFIPTSYSDHDDYWRNASRALFTSLLTKENLSKRTSSLTRWLLFETLSRLCTHVQGTKGAAHIDPSSEKTAASIRSVASSFLGCLEFIQDTGTPFSIRDWVKDEQQTNWLFLTCSPGQRASIRSLLSAWFSIATRSLIQLEPNRDRRIWFVVDELPSLNKLKDLEVFLTESRKFGGCALLALQSIAQLDSIYGREITKTIIGNCATKIAFSEQDNEIAYRISKSFGEREIQEYQEGISYGAHEARDGVNLSLQTKNQPLVSVTAIQSLKRNQAFVKLPENYSITKIKLSIA
jgi:type IV conjugative transfer system coupling protein TraD